jgi:hypothetical protein
MRETYEVQQTTLMQRGWIEIVESVKRLQEWMRRRKIKEEE